MSGAIVPCWEMIFSTYGSKRIPRRLMSTLCRLRNGNDSWLGNTIASRVCVNARIPCFHGQMRQLQNGNVHDSPKDFRPKRAVLMRKVTRYEYEKMATPQLDEAALEKRITAKGSDYAGLLQRHTEYFESLDKIQESLVKHGIEYKLIRRFDYGAKLVDWADVVLTAGGDGTFLMAASLVKGRSKPVIGINTDPDRSEGVLCLPKQYSLNIDKAISQLKEGDFKWKWRQRIRITLSDNPSDMDHQPVDLHKQTLDYPEYRFWEHVREHETHSNMTSPKTSDTRVLPILALNEVFLGESLSARMSFYELSIDGSPGQKQKSSGLTVCTGTGSTSWYFNINHILDNSVRDILKIAEKYGCNCEPTIHDLDKVKAIAREFNRSLRFDPAASSLAYTVRDPTSYGFFQVTSAKGFCKKLTVRSRMWDAWVVVDGSLSYRFNDGALVELSVNPEDALRCVDLV